MPVVTSITQSCDVCPSQWEGRTADGGWVYVRYRWGHLHVGFGYNLERAIWDETISQQLGNQSDGRMSYSQLKHATRGLVEWPKEMSNG